MLFRSLDQEGGDPQRPTGRVGPGELAVARGKQRNVAGWVARRRAGTRAAQAAETAQAAEAAQAVEAAQEAVAAASGQTGRTGQTHGVGDERESGA